MTKRSLPSLLGVALGTLGCTALPLATNHILVVKPIISSGNLQTQTTITPYSTGDIHHVVIKLLRNEGAEVVLTQKVIPAASLGNTLSFSQLQANTHYRIRAYAYTDAGESLCISDPSQSYTDVTVTTDDRPSLSSVGVHLIDKAFNGQATASGVVVTAGNLVTPGILALQYSVQGKTSLFLGNGAGFVDGNTSTARIKSPYNIAADAAGNLYVGDFGNSAIRKVTPQGTVTTIVGNGTAGFKDGAASQSQINAPGGLVVASNGDLYWTDAYNNVLQKLSGGVVTTIAGNGTYGFSDGTGTAASFNLPCGLAMDSQGNFFVADRSNLRIRKVTPSGVVTTFAGNGLVGTADGTGTSARFNYTFAITCDSSDNLFVVDEHSHTIRKITPAGVVSTFAGNGNAGLTDGIGTQAMFNLPYGITTDALGNLYIGDTNNHAIRRIDSQGNVTTIAGNGTAGYANGTGNAARFNNPRGLCVDPSGNLFVVEESNNCIRLIR